MQIKIMMSYHYTPIRMAIKNNDHNKCLRRMEQPLWKMVWQSLIKFKLNIHLLYDLGIPFLDIYAREMKTYIHTKACTQMFTVALFTSPKIENNSNIL